MYTANTVSITELETAITQLPAKDLDQLAEWLENYREEMWDRQIENDLATDRLDALLNEVEKESEAGLARSI